MRRARDRSGRQLVAAMASAAVRQNIIRGPRNAAAWIVARRPTRARGVEHTLAQARHGHALAQSGLAQVGLKTAPRRIYRATRGSSHREALASPVQNRLA
jgi:hypothetical protein